MAGSRPRKSWVPFQREAFQLSALVCVIATSCATAHLAPACPPFAAFVGAKFTALQDKFELYEARATKIRLLQLGLIPGLLQTPEYTRAILTAYDKFEQAEPQDINATVSKRLLRQQILYDNGKVFQIVLFESVLHYRHCPPAAMLTQIDWIRTISARDNVFVRIVPLMAELPIVAPHAFEIFDETALTIDLTTTAIFTEGQSDLRFYVEMFDAYFAAATENINPILTEASERFTRLLTA